LPLGAKLEALSVFLAQYSCWNSSGHNATRRSWMVSTAHTQPAEPSARAISPAAASATSGRYSGPPNFFGFSVYQSPASQKSWIVSSGMRRAWPVAAARSRNFGAKVRAFWSSVSPA
jgi:hypothetical protein